VLEVDELFVRTEFRGHGLGRAMLEFVAAQAREVNAVMLRLETEPENNHARKFYGKHGFTELERRLMRKRL
jgi:ribosomal protein S18 acetylase RimI-like enzyme